jgi:predicted Fe-S protein YdhL (DUF1289 family)
MNQNNSDDVPSPCVRNCCLDGNDICLGCGRSVDEIIEWGTASNVRRREILTLAEQRKSARPPPPDFFR